MIVTMDDLNNGFCITLMNREGEVITEVTSKDLEQIVSNVYKKAKRKPIQRDV